MLNKEKQLVLEYAKLSYKEKLFAGTSGNLSIYDSTSNLMAITPSGIDYEKMVLDNVVVMELNGKIIEGELKPSSEWRMHAEIYKHRNDVSSIVHTHSPYATSFAVAQKSIPVILVEMLPFLGGDVRVANFSVPGTEDVGKVALEPLRNRLCCLLANHGVLAIGKNIERAHITAVYAEDAAKIYSLSMAIGIPQQIEGFHLQQLKEKYKINDD